ncbi:MAG TPA: FkbM family methyltransferase [Caulobacteraceae bacterium]
MFVDRYRFAKHPSVIAEAAAPRMLALFQHPRSRALAALTQFRGRAEIRDALGAFADDESRAVFRDVMRYRAHGAAFSELAQDRDRYEALEAWMTRELPSQALSQRIESGTGETLRLWRVEHDGKTLELTASKYGLYWAFATDQYHFLRGTVRIAPEPGDVVVDAGAYLGETAARFALDVGPEGKVLAFDPSAFHARLAQENAERNGLADRVQVFAAGLAGVSNIDNAAAAEPTDDAVRETADEGRRMRDSDRQLALDDLCRWQGLGKVDFIKMDVEGSEIPALEGAHETILAHRPKLGISVYHRPTDLWAIPNLIRRKYPFYRLYLDHHSLYGEETVLYAQAM